MEFIAKMTTYLKMEKTIRETGIMDDGARCEKHALIGLWKSRPLHLVLGLCTGGAMVATVRQLVVG